MKILFHCHHSVGIGHLVRTLQLANACLELGQVVVICGGEVPRHLQIDSRIRIEQLAPLNMAQDGTLYDPRGLDEVSDILRQRRQTVFAIAEDFAPDCLVVEMFPFGRKKFAAEILALIGAVRARSSAKVFCSVRDVLVTARRDQPRHDLRAVRWLNQCFDALLVHSDPSLISLEKTFSICSSIEIPIHYTGYVSRTRKQHSGARKPLVVVSAGGGRVGEQLLDIAQQSAAQMEKALGCEMLLITGPMSEQKATSDNAGSKAKTVTFLNDLPDVLANAQLSISQCGYNTATDILGSGVPAVFVPFEAPREDEQIRRAELLSHCGRAITVRADSLDVNVLVDAARRALTQSIETEQSLDVNLDGARQSSVIISECLQYV